MKTTRAPAKTAAKEGRRLTEKEWNYLQHRVGILWRQLAWGGGTVMILGSGIGLWAWWASPEGKYLVGSLGAALIVLSISFVVYEGRKLFRLRLDRKRRVAKRRIRIFPFRLFWFQPMKGCQVRSEEAEILPHWSHFFDYLRPIDGDGCLDIEAEIYETSYANYVISLSNGLSVDSEAPTGLLDTFAMNRSRAIVWFSFVLFGSALAGILLNEMLRIFPIAPSLTEFFEVLLVPFLCALAFLSALGVPAIYFWRRHKQALARIEAMYEAEGLPERGHAKNVGSAIDNASSDKSNHERSNVPSNEKRTS